MWGYSIAGALIGTLMSLGGAFLLVPLLLKGGRPTQFSVESLGDVSVINAFPAGILLGESRK